MSNNGNESSDSDRSASDESSNDGYSNDGIEYRHYVNPIMRYVPEEMRSEVRKLCKDTARLYGDKRLVKRIAFHYPILQDETETCMQKNCNESTSTKCGVCHAFLCIDSENNCFTKFHDIH